MFFFYSYLIVFTNVPMASDTYTADSRGNQRRSDLIFYNFQTKYVQVRGYVLTTRPVHFLVTLYAHSAHDCLAGFSRRLEDWFYVSTIIVHRTGYGY